ncbi:MAG TPA: hypothetical protein VLB47_02905, partial [Solirubrobacteraceae bacterium]|nr:hypothetical protein [Solirubrobacteraceae bacterium]
HAARARGDAVQQSVEQWIAEDGPCRRQARDGIAAAASGGTLTADDAATARELLSVPYGVDALHAMAQPLDAQLAVAQHAFATVRVRDRVLRSGARGMARGLAALRALPDVDFCGFAQQWASRGYALDAYVELTATIDASGIDQPAVQRAKKRLRRLGATAAQARRFEGFPLSVLM